MTDSFSSFLQKYSQLSVRKVIILETPDSETVYRLLCHIMCLSSIFIWWIHFWWCYYTLCLCVGIFCFLVFFSEEDFLPQSSLGWSGSNPLRSAYFPQRCSMCCYVSSHRGGYLYRLSPGVSLVSTYRYTDLAYKVMVRALCLFYWKPLL